VAKFWVSLWYLDYLFNNFNDFCDLKVFVTFSWSQHQWLVKPGLLLSPERQIMEAEQKAVSTSAEKTVIKGVTQLKTPVFL